MQTAEQDAAKGTKREQLCGVVRTELAGLGVRDKKARLQPALCSLEETSEPGTLPGLNLELKLEIPVQVYVAVPRSSKKDAKYLKPTAQAH